MNMPTSSDRLKKMTERMKGSGKTKTSGHDPLGKKTGATATKRGSTYDYRKGSKAPDPRKKKDDRAKTRAEAIAKRLTARKLKTAARAKRAAEKKAARKAKTEARAKARAAKIAARNKKRGK